MLKFDIAGMKTGLMEALFVECNEITTWLLSQVQGIAPSEVDRAQMGKEVFVIGGQVFGSVWAGGVGALTTEWGSGSLANESNPAWDEYVQSQYYNPSRQPYGHPISGRPAGSYVNLDGETKISTGRMEGLNLEGFLPPTPAQHWFQGIVERSRNEILERLVQVVQLFPFHNYIQSDGR